jgi:hypothetical protein
MNKIIKAALAAKFNNANVDALLEVVNATENPEAATELILGVYEQPQINLAAHPNFCPDEQNKMFVRYDKWRDRIIYSYQYTKKTEGDGPAPVPEKRESSCSVKQWNTGDRW